MTAEFIKGEELLNREWKIDDEIVYNSDPEDIGNEHLHSYQGNIINIFQNNDKNMILIQLPYGKIQTPLHKIKVLLLPGNNSNNKNKIQQLFVYGRLCEIYCNAESARLYGFRLYKHKNEDIPFALITNNKFDYVNGRLLSWNDPNTFKHKLSTSDDRNNLYERTTVDVLNQNGNMVKAIVYYRNNINMEELEFCDEIPDGDWLKRHWIQNNENENKNDANLDAIDLIDTLKNALIKIYDKMNQFDNEELIDSTPLPIEHEELEELKDDEECFGISGDDIAVINNCKTIKKFRSSVHSVFGKYNIKSMTDNVYKWTFKINNGGDGLLVIGIVSILDDIIINETNKPFYSNQKADSYGNCYGYNVFNGFKISPDEIAKYAMKAKTNDVIDMELNMKNQTLGYYINGTFQDIAFNQIKKDEKISYKIAVSLQKNKDEISIQHFKVINAL